MGHQQRIASIAFGAALAACSSGDDPTGQVGVVPVVAPPPAIAGQGAAGQPAAAAARPTGQMGTPATPVVPPAVPSATPVSADCIGVDVRGLQYSPGGDVLPNLCEPFHPVLNNPYAVRCVDADPGYATGYPGDDFCILPPPPELGTQIRVGPDSYDNVPARYLMSPGEELNDYYYVNAPNTEPHYFYRVNLRMRAGSHHMINRMLPDDIEDGWAVRESTVSGEAFPGAQRPDQDRPNGTLAVPPENAGLGQRIGANQQFSFNLHHFNLTDGPTLREVWVNVWYKPQAEVTDQMGGLALFGNPADLNIPPGVRRELHYECPVQGDSRIITLNGHRHAWTERFGVWITRANGSVDSVYESFDYNDMPTYQYDSISQNPVPNSELNQDGATSGLLHVSTGDTIHFVCDVNNQSDVQLRFANEVLTGEMCILFGSYSGDGFRNCRFLQNRPLN